MYCMESESLGGVAFWVRDEKTFCSKRLQNAHSMGQYMDYQGHINILWNPPPPIWEYWEGLCAYIIVKGNQFGTLGINFPKNEVRGVYPTPIAPNATCPYPDKLFGWHTLYQPCARKGQLGDISEVAIPVTGRDVSGIWGGTGRRGGGGGVLEKIESSWYLRMNMMVLGSIWPVVRGNTQKAHWIYTHITGDNMGGHSLPYLHTLLYFILPVGALV